MHTPGPWNLSLTMAGRTVSVHEKRVACVYDDHDMPMTECDANARLIAAAPDLLEALKASRSHAFYMAEFTGVPVPSELVTIFESAIAKAEGRA